MPKGILRGPFAALILALLPLAAAAQELCGAGLSCTDPYAVCAPVLEENLFRCRPAENRCEAGFDLSLFPPPTPPEMVDGRMLTQETCEARDGCRFVPGGPCYCPPGLECYCGGGPPPQCVGAEAG